MAGDQHTCARLRGGSVRCWGSGYAGTLGSGVDYPSDKRPHGIVKVRGLENATALVARDFASCALRRDQKVVCWGSIGLGAPGHPELAPTVIESLPPVTKIYAKHNTICALTLEGEALCWGDDFGRTLASFAPPQ